MVPSAVHYNTAAIAERHRRDGLHTHTCHRDIVMHTHAQARTPHAPHPRHMYHTRTHARTHARPPCTPRQVQPGRGPQRWRGRRFSWCPCRSVPSLGRPRATQCTHPCPPPGPPRPRHGLLKQGPARHGLRLCKIAKHTSCVFEYAVLSFYKRMVQRPGAYKRNTICFCSGFQSGSKHSMCGTPLYGKVDPGLLVIAVAEVHRLQKTTAPTHTSIKTELTPTTGARAR